MDHFHRKADTYGVFPLMDGPASKQSIIGEVRDMHRWRWCTDEERSAELFQDLKSPVIEKETRTYRASYGKECAEYSMKDVEVSVHARTANLGVGDVSAASGVSWIHQRKAAIGFCQD